jgi:hypothetical protein
MKNLHVAVLATLFGISAASGIALTQAQHPGNDSGLLAATASIASADKDSRGNGRNQNRNNNGQYGQNGQCNTNGNNNGARRGDADDNNQGNQGNRGNRGAGHGQKRGWQNPNNPHSCGTNGNGNYCNNGQSNGQYTGQNGQNGQYNCNANGGGAGQQGNSTLRGTITSVNGNQVTLMAGFGQSVTINDQPALNNQQTGRVVVGRYVTAYGYYQNGVFYATSLQ